MVTVVMTSGLVHFDISPFDLVVKCMIITILTISVTMDLYSHSGTLSVEPISHSATIHRGRK